MRSCKIVDWRNPEGLIEIDVGGRGWEDGPTAVVLYGGRSSNDTTRRLLQRVVKPMLCKNSNKQ